MGYRVTTFSASSDGMKNHQSVLFQYKWNIEPPDLPVPLLMGFRVTGASFPSTDGISSHLTRPFCSTTDGI
ncbi:hypothetical protein XELAEV_18026423mg [Xenopus laevis]|uniref:Uncharacterized protein n=1 Tax=Xenopus laevis TaxID=8355 RepID=A0A974CW42_XENLA|nr:hypothetical protein XELAEV_18026423mg [Xenopus laevis]